VVTQTIANLERQLGLKLFDRTARKPVIVGHAESLLADARRIVRDVHRLEARARSLVSGLESELSVVVDVMFPEAERDARRGRLREGVPSHGASPPRRGACEERTGSPLERGRACVPS
jgi:hypothetical protein